MIKLSILIVDDDKNTRLVMRTILERVYPVEIFEAADNDEAWHILRRHKIDVITTDIVRPKATGIDFIREVRRDRKYSAVPILVMSGSITQEIAQEIAALNAFFDQKPINLHHFIQLIGMAVHMRKDPDIAMLNMGTELPGLDYKSDVDITTSDERAAIAKDIIAMANSGGGTIVVGVDEVSRGEFKKRGVSAKHLANYETSVINRAVKKFMSPPVSVLARRVVDRGRTYIFLTIPSAADELVLVARMNERAGIYPGRIYIRTAASESSELQDPADLRRIVDRIIRYRISTLLNR